MTMLIYHFALPVRTVVLKFYFSLTILPFNRNWKSEIFREC